MTCIQKLNGKAVRFPAFCCGRAAVKCNDMTCRTMHGCQQFRELNATTHIHDQSISCGNLSCYVQTLQCTICLLSGDWYLLGCGAVSICNRLTIWHGVSQDASVFTGKYLPVSFVILQEEFILRGKYLLNDTVSYPSRHHSLSTVPLKPQSHISVCGAGTLLSASQISSCVSCCRMTQSAADSERRASHASL